MEYSSMAILAGILLAGASVVLGAKYKQDKDKAYQLTELLSKIVDAAQDDGVTEKEFQEIVASAKNLLTKPEAEPS
jgi:hypothetical protein